MPSLYPSCLPQTIICSLLELVSGLAKYFQQCGSRKDDGGLLGALTRAKQVGHSHLPGANIFEFCCCCCCCCHVGRWAVRISISLIPALWEIGVKIRSPTGAQTLVPPIPGGDINYQTNQHGRAGTSEWRWTLLNKRRSKWSLSTGPSSPTLVNCYLVLPHKQLCCKTIQKATGFLPVATIITQRRVEATAAQHGAAGRSFAAVQLPMGMSPTGV